MGGWKRIGRAQAPSRGKGAGMGREVNGVGNEEREKTKGSDEEKIGTDSYGTDHMG